MQKGRDQIQATDRQPVRIRRFGSLLKSKNYTPPEAPTNWRQYPDLPDWAGELPKQELITQAVPCHFNPRPAGYEMGIKLFATAAIVSIAAGLLLLPAIYESIGTYGLAAGISYVALSIVVLIYNRNRQAKSLKELAHQTFSQTPREKEREKEEQFSIYSENLLRLNGVDAKEINVKLLDDSTAKELPKQFRGLGDTVAIVPTKERTVLLIGKKALANLSQEQFEAVIAHESSHYHNMANEQYRTFMNLGKLFLIQGMGLSLIFTADVPNPLFWSYMGAALMEAQSKQIDERRADRNAVLATGNEKDLQDALYRLYKRALGRDEKQKIVTSYLMRLFSPFKEHPLFPTRVRHANYVARRHGLKPN